MNTAPSATTTTADLYETDGIIEAVVSAVADAEGVSPLEVQPLAGVIDPDALDALFRDCASEVTVEFGYHDYRVRVFGDERVTVEVYDD